MILAYVDQSLAGLPAWKTVFKPFDLGYLNDAHGSMTMKELSSMPLEQAPADHLEKRPFLYFIKEDKKAIGALQSALEKDGIQIDAMAVMTEANQSWKLTDLIEEVEAESAIFAKRDRLADLVNGADRDLMKQDPAYARAVANCAGLLMADDAPEKLLDMGIELLESANEILKN